MKVVTEWIRLAGVCMNNEKKLRIVRRLVWVPFKSGRVKGVSVRTLDDLACLVVQ